MTKDRIIIDIRTLFEEEDYYKPKRVSNFQKNNHTEYESNADRKTLNNLLELRSFSRKLELTQNEFEKPNYLNSM